MGWRQDPAHCDNAHNQGRVAARAAGVDETTWRACMPGTFRRRFVQRRRIGYMRLCTKAPGPDSVTVSKTREQRVLRRVSVRACASRNCDGWALAERHMGHALIRRSARQAWNGTTRVGVQAESAGLQAQSTTRLLSIISSKSSPWNGVASGMCHDHCPASPLMPRLWCRCNTSHTLPCPQVRCG